MTMRKWTVPIAGILMSLSFGGAAATQDTPASPRVTIDSNQVIDACMSPADRQRSWDDSSPALRHQILVCLTMASARQLNAGLPRQLDALTRLDQVSAADTELSYHYSVGRLTAELPGDLAGRLETATHAYVCAQPDMVSTMQRGGAYAYRWTDSAGQLIHQMRITGC
jgi:hypothetical protein